jgi:hypothetical protein
VLRHLLDALADRPHAERLPEGEDRARDRRVRLVARDPVDERLVDLEHVHREALQVGERRVAGPEVVDGQRTPSALSACSRASVASVSRRASSP